MFLTEVFKIVKKLFWCKVPGGGIRPIDAEASGHGLGCLQCHMEDRKSTWFSYLRKRDQTVCSC